MTAPADAQWDAEINARRNVFPSTDIWPMVESLRRAGRWVNGLPDHRREYDEAAEVVREKRRAVVISVERRSGMCGFFGRPRHRHGYSLFADLLSPRHAARKHRSEVQS